MIRLYNHNIWGSYKETEAIANRADLLLGIIHQQNPDIITFQECGPTTFRAEKPGLIDRLLAVYAEASPENAHENFTPVFYRRDRFTLIESGFHPYSGLNDIMSKSITYAVLEDKASMRRVAFASTHFWFKATGDVDEEQRRENAREAAAIARDVIRRYGIPVIVAGDLNSCDANGQGLGGYEQMKSEGFKDVRYTASVSTDSHTEHYYPPRGEDGNYLPGEKPSHTLDYIFTMGEGVTAYRFAVLTDDASLAASDHCPLVSDFTVK